LICYEPDVLLHLNISNKTENRGKKINILSLFLSLSENLTLTKKKSRFLERERERGRKKREYREYSFQIS